MSFNCSLSRRDKPVLRVSVRDVWTSGEADRSVSIVNVIACDLHLFYLLRVVPVWPSIIPSVDACVAGICLGSSRGGSGANIPHITTCDLHSFLTCRLLTSRSFHMS